MTQIRKIWWERLDSVWIGVFSYFLLISMVSHSNTGSGFVDDSIGILNSFDRAGWSEFWDSYQFTSIYWLHDLINILIYLLFHKNNFAWFYITLFCHASSAYLFYRYFKLVLETFEINQGRVIALLSSLCFLFGAYNTEPLFWLGANHYIFSMLFLTVALYYLVVKKSANNRSGLFLFYVAYTIFTTMHEIVLVYPVIFGIHHYFFYDTRWKKSLVFFIPFVLINCIYFIATLLIKGHLMPHYGSRHFENIHAYKYGYTLYQYIVKQFLFIHNFPSHIREKFYEVDIVTMIIFFSILLFVGVFYFFRIVIRRNLLRPYILFILSLLVLFLPIFNMYFMWHFRLENDRLGYYIAPFLFILFFIFSTSLLPRLLIPLGICTLILNICILKINQGEIEKSIHFTEKILPSSYQKFQSLKPIVINLPYNFNHFYTYRSEHRLCDAQYFFYKKDVAYQYVASMPFFSANDSVVIKQQTDSTFHIALAAPGSWFMNGMIGGSDYENESVKVDYADDNQSLDLVLKKRNKKSPILYVSGKRGFVEWEKGS